MSTLVNLFTFDIFYYIEYLLLPLRKGVLLSSTLLRVKFSSVHVHEHFPSKEQNGEASMAKANGYMNRRYPAAKTSMR